MKTMNETTGTVNQGKVILSAGRHLPDGMIVRIVWDEDDIAKLQPYDRQSLTEADVRDDLAWATGKRFAV